MLCFSVDSPESLENVESKWVGEIAENCPGVKLVLVALKCDLRGESGDDADDAAAAQEAKRPCIDYKQGLAVAEKIRALRYLGKWSALFPNGVVNGLALTMLRLTECSAKRNRGVNEAFTEAARVALTVKAKNEKQGGMKSCNVM